MKKEMIQDGVHSYTEEECYVPPKEKAVQEHLDWFMGLKLGLMMHWAPGCQLGTLESWPLSDGDKVIYSKYAGTEVKLDDDQEYIIVKQSDVLAVIE